MSFSGSPSVQTLLSEIICHGFDVWRDHMHCHCIVCCWGWGTLSTATAANESWLLEVFNRVISFPRTCTFFPPRKLNLWANGYFETERLFETLCWSLYVCDVLFWNTVGCIDSVHPNGYPTWFPESFPTRGPSRRGPWERGWWLPPNVLTSQCPVISFISVLRRAAWWEIMGLLDVRRVTFILSQCHFERHVKE